MSRTDEHPTPVEERPRRPDASMDLLNNLRETALEPSYAAAVAERGSQRSRGVVLLPALVVVGLLFGIALGNQWRAAPALQQERADLITRITTTETRIDELRAQKRRPELRWADLSEHEAEVLSSVLSDQTAHAPDDALAARELVNKLMSQLAAPDRLVLQLLDLEQKSVAEVASLTGWNRAVVKVRAFRARRKLQKLFQTLKRQENS